MGARVSFPGAKLEHTLEEGVFVECEPGTFLIVRRLELTPDSPLYPVLSREDSSPRRSGGQPPKPVRLGPAHYYVEQQAHRSWGAVAGREVRYLTVTADDAASWTTELEVLKRLGALDLLRALGLDDAAVALTMGDLDAARVQWIRWKDGVR